MQLADIELADALLDFRTVAHDHPDMVLVGDDRLGCRLGIKRVVGAAPTDIDFILEGSFFKLLMLAYASEIIIFNTSSVRTCVPNLFISILNWGKNVYYIRNANSWLKFPRIFPGLKYFPHRLVQYICKTFMLLSRKSILVEKWTIKEYVENRLVIKNVDVIPFICVVGVFYVRGSQDVFDL